jgi:hypothetical protein
VCSAACGQPGDGTCGGGTCCASNGKCQTQGLATACGANCLDCTGNAAGQQCVAGACGCMVASDCLPGYACNIRTHVCSQSCGSAVYTACNGGCCPPPTFAPSMCATGTADTACGLTGAACVDCTQTNRTCNSANGMCH